MHTARSVVLSTVDAGIAVVTLNRPDSLNAMSADLMETLRECLLAASEDSDVRCVVLRGAGTSFCAGGDINEIAERQAQTTESSSPGATTERYHRTLIRHSESVTLLRTMPKPTIAAVHGWAVGGGMSLALAADFRLVARGARMRAGFASNSLSGDFGISSLLLRAVGTLRARELLMLDPVIDSSMAEMLGLATLVCEDDEMEAELKRFAGSLASAPTIALGRMKDNLNLAETHTLTEVIAAESANQRVTANTSDAHEAARARATRREARFTGQ